jgi:hypothetical protein
LEKIYGHPPIMTVLPYMAGAFAVLVLWSIIGGVTTKGARQEIEVRGRLNVSLLTHKVASGDATFAEKVMISIMTLCGAFISLPFIFASAILGGLAYAVVQVVK